MALLYIQEGFNLYVGDNGPDNNKKLNLESVKLPDLEEMTQEFYAGGAIGQISIGGMGLKALEASFKQKGWDPQTMAKFGIGRVNQEPFTVYGLVRDKNGNAPMQVKAVIRGRLTKIAPDELKRGDLFGHDYAIREILHYELYLNKLEKYFYDFAGSDWRVDGVDQFADERAMLAL